MLDARSCKHDHDRLMQTFRLPQPILTLLLRLASFFLEVFCFNLERCKHNTRVGIRQTVCERLSRSEEISCSRGAPVVVFALTRNATHAFLLVLSFRHLFPAPPRLQVESRGGHDRDVRETGVSACRIIVLCG